MASISNDAGGGRRLLFSFGGRRHSIRLGKVTSKVAGAIKLRVERLIEARQANLPVDHETATWLAGIGDDLAGRLAAAGLVPARAAATTTTLGPFLEAFIAGRTDVGKGTANGYRTSRNRLVEYFGAGRDMAAVTEDDADAFVIWLKGRGYAQATVGREVKHARQFFAAAIRRRLLTANPFEGVKAPGQVNDARAFFVTTDMAAAVLAACPDDEWRLVFALCRWGGLRCPSELSRLLRDEIDWPHGRFLVHSPKTRHQAKPSRWVPIFPELRPYLERARDSRSKQIVNLPLDDRKNLRTRLHGIIRRAGLTPWPRLFQNLRSTRETELARLHPLHLVTAWLGNTARVATAHYLQVTADDYLRAAQNPSQHVAETTRNGPQVETAVAAQGDPVRGDATNCENVQDGQVSREGFEAYNATRRADQELGQSADGRGANSVALPRLVALWPSLTADVQAAIMGLAEGRSGRTAA